MNPATNRFCRLVIQVLRSIYLLDNAVLHNYDSGTQCHSLGLVMCYIDDGGAQSLMQLSDLDTHLYTQLSIQVGQRLVHQEYLRITNDSTSHSNTLSLTTGQSLRLTIKQLSRDPGSLQLLVTILSISSFGTFA